MCGCVCLRAYPVFSVLRYMAEGPDRQAEDFFSTLCSFITVRAPVDVVYCLFCRLTLALSHPFSLCCFLAKAFDRSHLEISRQVAKEKRSADAAKEKEAKKKEKEDKLKKRLSGRRASVV